MFQSKKKLLGGGVVHLSHFALFGRNSVVVVVVVVVEEGDRIHSRMLGKVG
jgi:hypothetical protein